jgi:predicted branched-subunit amino acid permease
VAFSAIAFAGAAQIAAFNMLGSGVPILVVIGAATMINLRFALYSASLSPHLAHESRPRRLVGAYLLTDHAYALSMARSTGTRAPRAVAAFYLGAAATFWVTWQVCTLIGALLGGRLPHQIPLQFAVSLSFLALLVPMLTDSAAWSAAAVAALCATAAQSAPGNVGMIGGTVAGAVVGWLVAKTRAVP